MVQGELRGLKVQGRGAGKSGDGCASKAPACSADEVVLYAVQCPCCAASACQLAGSPSHPPCGDLMQHLPRHCPGQARPSTGQFWVCWRVVQVERPRMDVGSGGKGGGGGGGRGRTARRLGGGGGCRLKRRCCPPVLGNPLPGVPPEPLKDDSWASTCVAASSSTRAAASVLQQRAPSMTAACVTVAQLQGLGTLQPRGRKVRTSMPHEYSDSLSGWLGAGWLGWR